MGIAIRIENLSKAYYLGEISTGTVSRDLERWWAKKRGKEDPFLKIGEANDIAIKGNNDVVWSLKNINFEIQQGDAVGIIGRNGAGKSTLLKLLSRVTAPTSGIIKARGRIASLLEVGTGFHPDLTGRENIFLNGAILGMRKHEIVKKFDEIVDFSGVERYIDTPVKRYSSGMYVRLAFAVAAHLDSEILIVDEVLAVGDAEFQKKCLGKMGEVSKEGGRTVLFVSHNMAAISSLCNNAILLNKGYIEYKGSVENTLTKYITTRRVYSSGHIVFTGNEPERFGEKKYGLWKSVTLKNQSDTVTDIFVMGEKMIIELEIDIFTPGDEFEIGIGIGNMQEVFLHYVLSNWEGVSSISKTGKTIIEVELPYIYLFPGNYLLNIWISLRGAYYDDAIHNAINFRVDEGKVNQYDTYFERFSKNTQVYIPSTWKIL